MTLCLCWWIHLWMFYTWHTLLDRFLCQHSSFHGDKKQDADTLIHVTVAVIEKVKLWNHTLFGASNPRFYRHHWSGNITLLAESLLKTLFCCQRYTYTDFLESGRAAICQMSHGWECLYCAVWKRFEWVAFWGVIQILIHLSLYNILKWQIPVFPHRWEDWPPPRATSNMISL